MSLSPNERTELQVAARILDRVAATARNPVEARAVEQVRRLVLLLSNHPVGALVVLSLLGDDSEKALHDHFEIEVDAK